jgi:hypothetical protein
MEEQQSGPKRRVERRALKGLMPLIFVIFVLLLASLYFIFPQNDSDKNISSTDALETTLSTSSQNSTGQASSKPDESLDPSENEDIPDNLTKQTESATPGIDRDNEVSTNPDCQDNADTVASFFQLLDTREYIQAFDLGGKSDVYFPSLIQRLADNPPIVTGETNDLFTILQNTAHFFRIIGKKNILVLKGILDREKATFEQTLADFYELTRQSGCLQERFNLNLPVDSLYLYSGFFLNTMGGRLYLFRRDSMSRMVVNFYAIVTVENANRQGRNQYGIEIKSSIDSLIEEIESSKIDLKMREYYLDTLYDLKEKYQ